jgi:hypothetical protein
MLPGQRKNGVLEIWKETENAICGMRTERRNKNKEIK